MIVLPLFNLHQIGISSDRIHMCSRFLHTSHFHGYSLPQILSIAILILTPFSDLAHAQNK